MSSEPNSRRINPRVFVEEYVRGASEDELCEKFSLGRSQLMRVIGILEKRGEITEKERSARTANMRIRFGTEGQGPDTSTYRKGEVELDSGLVLHCPSCGAAVPRGSETCHYCAAPLDFSLKGKTLICPHCFTRTGAEGRFCMRCAKPIKGLVEKGKLLQDRLCPRCRVAMTGQLVREFSVAECLQCQGVFVPHETFEMMQESRDSAVLSARQVRRETVDRAEQVRYVRCPICSNMMNRVNFGRISGVIIDSCRDHGIWFDSGEIEKVMEFISRGGLHKARELEIEKLKDQESLARLRAGHEGLDKDAMRYSMGLEVPHDGFEILHAAGKLFEYLKDIYK